MPINLTDLTGCSSWENQTDEANFLLAVQTDFGQDQVPRVAADFVIVQFHKSSKL